MRILPGLSVVALAGLVTGLSTLAPATGEAPPGETRAPTKIYPRRGARETVELPRGEHNLFALLQQLADASGETLFVAGDIPATRTIRLDRAIRRLDLETTRELLEAGGWTMSRETIQGDSVWLVRRPVASPRGKRGRLVRSGDPSGSGEGPDPEATTDARRRAGEDRRSPRPAAREAAGGAARTGPTPRAAPTVRIYQRMDGGAGSWMVTFETGSQEQAETVARTVELILEGQRRSSRQGRTRPDGRTGRRP